MGFREALLISLGAAQLGLAISALAGSPLGLPPGPIPADNPQTPAKIALGDKPFHDTRFSATGLPRT